MNGELKKKKMSRNNAPSSEEGDAVGVVLVVERPPIGRSRLPRPGVAVRALVRAGEVALVLLAPLRVRRRRRIQPWLRVRVRVVMH